MKILFIYLALFLLTSCSENIRPVDTAVENQILYIGNGTEPQDLDPHIVTGVPESKVLMALLEGLVIRNPEGPNPLPGVARDWFISNGGKTYTFYLREDAFWSNGDRVTADDFVYSWNRMLMPSLGSKYPDMLYDLVNAEEFNKGKIEDFSKVGVKALDSATLEVTLKNPAPYFLELLCHYTTRPVHKSTIEKFGDMDTAGSQWTRPGNFVGNGP
ncbi:MAG: ABC transporter substrate-binding protein, partial [Gammaproteobacteria bacterium]